jgi:UDP:flavonoid glycosyltransferase YjiC (YdhE family)
MSDILFVTWDGGGNVAPALGIAAELTRRGHTACFLGHARQREAIEAAGFVFQPFTHARSWSAAAPNPGFKGTLKQLGVFCDRGMGEDLLLAVRERPPELVVIDHLLFGAQRAAERAGLKRAILVHTLYGQQRQTWSSGMGSLLVRVRGLRPVEMWSRADLILAATLPAIDRYQPVPERVHHTGPVWQSGQPAPAVPANGEPLVLVSLSTLYQDGQAQALQAILDGLARLPVRVLATTGPSIDPATLRAPANAEVRRYLPHAEVMARASLVVGHGGHSTAMAALARDLPLLIMPMYPLGDQPVVGRELERLGAARVRPKTAPAERIAATVREMLADGSYRAAAQALGAKIRARDGASVAADALEEVLAAVPTGAR